MRTLVVGCDASGKSSLVEGISGRYGDIAFEATSTDESRRFKHDNLDTLIDDELVNEREDLYMRLSRTVLGRLAMSSTADSYIGTDSTLVTRLSHNVMRRCIGGKAIEYDKLVEQWVKDEAEFGLAPPNIVAITYAPFDLIRSRIQARYDNGDKDEKFWGFNSPFFLEKYQNAWLEVREYLPQAGISCISFDTSLATIEDSLSVYATVRDGHSNPAPPISLVSPLSQIPRQ